jgi:aspartate/methionine/tyrosine aminotransferase
VKLAKRISRLGSENAFVVLAEVTKLKEQGRDIINFGVGEPDFRREYV